MGLSRKSLKWAGGAVLVAVVTIAGIALLEKEPGGSGYPDFGRPPAPFPSGQSEADDARAREHPIEVTFDLERQAKTRVRVLRKVVTEPDEARSGSNETDATDSPSNDGPTVVSARLEGDLEADDGSGQFPADQVTVGAAPEGTSGLRLTVTLNPAEPEAVADGAYHGRIIVEGGGPEPFGFPLHVVLGDRFVGMWRAALVLLLGAAVGLCVKWVTEVGGELGSLRRQESRLNRFFAALLDGLPPEVVSLLGEARARILSQETEGLRDQLNEVERRKTDLSSLARAIRALKAKIKAQRGYLGDEPTHLMLFAIERENDWITQKLNESWPWPTKTRPVEEAVAAATEFEGLTWLLACYPDADAEQKKVLDKVLSEYANGRMKEGLERWLEYVSANNPGTTRAEFHKEKEWLQTPDAVLPNGPAGDTSRPGIMDFILRHARKLAAAASVLVVTLVGLQLQYLNNLSFVGRPSDWLSLFLWAFAVELSGVSLLELVGRLTPSPTPSSR